MTIEQEIKRHEKEVMASVSKRYAACCRRCKGNEGFQRHEIRRRTFYCQLKNGQPGAVRSWLVRWKCLNCTCTFTDYPPFALPYKRHIKPAIFEMVMKMCRDQKATYRSSTNGRAGHSSLWRWFDWLSSLFVQGQACARFILSADPNSLLHRNDYFVPPYKSRSKSRATVLTIGFQVIDRFMAFERFVAENFPQVRNTASPTGDAILQSDNISHTRSTLACTFLAFPRHPH